MKHYIMDSSGDVEIVFYVKIKLINKISKSFHGR